MLENWACYTLFGLVSLYIKQCCKSCAMIQNLNLWKCSLISTKSDKLKMSVMVQEQAKGAHINSSKLHGSEQTSQLQEFSQPPPRTACEERAQPSYCPKPELPSTSYTHASGDNSNGSIRVSIAVNADGETCQMRFNYPDSSTTRQASNEGMVKSSIVLKLSE